MEVGIHEAKTHFSKLLRRVAAGEEVLILRNRQVVARLVPPARTAERTFGTDAGAFEVPEDFNDPLPPEIQGYFE
jgi:prevent-host-death family protein